MSTSDDSSTTVDDLPQKMLRDQRSATIWYRHAPDAQKHEFPLELVQQWYEQHSILISARFSFDRGETWESIIDLRRRNGPCFPFVPKSETGEEEEGFGSIAAARRMVSAARDEVERLEQERDEVQRQVEEEERMLEKLKEMEKKLGQRKQPGREKCAQVEGRMLQVAAKVQREAQPAVKKSTPPKAAVRPVARPVAPMKGKAAKAVASRITPILPIARPRLFPMLQPSTLPNDYTASAATFFLLRDLLQKGLPAAAKAATATTFDPPPSCLLCPAADPLTDLDSFMAHVLSQKHCREVISAGGAISAAQCFFWLDIIQKGWTTHKPV